MSARVKSCCVVGCKNRDARRYVIAAEENCRRVWLERIGNVKMFELNENQMKNMRICKTHYHEDCIEKSGKLKRGSLPSINVPGYAEGDGAIFFKNSPIKFRSEALLKNIEELGPSTSFGGSPKPRVIAPERTYQNFKRRKLSTHLSESDVSTELFFSKFSNSCENESALVVKNPVRSRRRVKSLSEGEFLQITIELYKISKISVITEYTKANFTYSVHT
ncbi:uncharacterized protein LOC123319203 [Coccinella septempunctata]|uniref:uncharacterized protein LOC123319203 n=1 Tax=Coccinella septempunctata TaxID=41139 RepID=UPI001D083ADD|nr:uncharacterized protein LOC123319203 [Coccinella septempunctata]